MPRIMNYYRTESAGSMNREGNDSWAEKWTFIVDQSVSPDWIVNHRLTPKLNKELDHARGYFYASVNPKQTGRFVWEFDCQASPIKWSELPDNPLNEPADISVDSELLSEPTMFDAKGRPIVTTAGEWVAGVQRERLRLIYRVSKKIGSDPNWLDNYPGAINSDAVRLRGRVRPKHSLMLRRVSLGPYTKKDNVSFCSLEFELHYDPLGWIQRIWNVGTIQLVEFRTEAGKKAWRQERILTEGSSPKPIDNAVPIDRKGQMIPGVLDPTGEVPLDTSKLVALSIQTSIDVPFNGVLPLT